MRKLKNRRIPNGTYGGVRGRRAEARLLLDGRRLSISGCAAVGILMTLSQKREIDSAAGSLLRRELPTGLRDGGGIFASETSGGQAIRCQTVQPAARLSANLRLLRRTRLCEADPSPGLWPPPFSKGGRFMRIKSSVTNCFLLAA
jgi:hypothetical protein